MNNFIVLLTIIFLATACNFDGDRQYSIRYPATVEFENISKNTIYLKSINSTENFKGGFLLTGEQIDSGATLSLEISESTYDALLAGYFVLKGECGEIKDWRKEGANLAQKAVENSNEWKITISIEDCSM